MMTGSRKSIKQIPTRPKGNVEKTLVALLAAIREHEKGSQTYLREDMARLYGYASEVREDPEQFVEFQTSKPVAKLKRPLRTSDQTLRAVMNLAYSSKLASARFRRLKTFWDSRSPADAVLNDLKINGASRKTLKLVMEPECFVAFDLGRFSAGELFGLVINAQFRSPERIFCEIVSVTEV